MERRSAKRLLGTGPLSELRKRGPGLFSCSDQYSSKNCTEIEAQIATNHYWKIRLKHIHAMQFMWKIKKGKNNLTFLCLSSLVSESSTCFHDGKANPWSPCWLPCHLPFLTSSSSRDKMLQLYSKMPGTERNWSFCTIQENGESL